MLKRNELAVMAVLEMLAVQQEEQSQPFCNYKWLLGKKSILV
jgi:hypothetical protein